MQHRHASWAHNNQPKLAIGDLSLHGLVSGAPKLRLPKYPPKATSAGFALNAVGLPVWGAIQRPIEN